eukprot:365141-Chlamydomonas_euryale.AAC.3
MPPVVEPGAPARTHGGLACANLPRALCSRPFAPLPLAFKTRVAEARGRHMPGAEHAHSALACMVDHHGALCTLTAAAQRPGARGARGRQARGAVLLEKPAHVLRDAAAADAADVVRRRRADQHGAKHEQRHRGGHDGGGGGARRPSQTARPRHVTPPPG